MTAETASTSSNDDAEPVAGRRRISNEGVAPFPGTYVKTCGVAGRPAGVVGKNPAWPPAARGWATVVNDAAVPVESTRTSEAGILTCPPDVNATTMSVLPGTKLVPVNVTAVPPATGPDDGERPVAVGSGSGVAGTYVKTCGVAGRPAGVVGKNPAWPPAARGWATVVNDAAVPVESTRTSEAGILTCPPDVNATTMSVLPGTKLVPVNVTAVPPATGPDDGERPVAVGTSARAADGETSRAFAIVGDPTTVTPTATARTAIHRDHLAWCSVPTDQRLTP